MLAGKRPTKAIVVALAGLLIAICLVAPLLADVSVDPSGRYYKDSSGKPVFLIGYYAWSATVDGYHIDQPSRYDDMMNQGAPYKFNYIRMILGGNKVNGSSNPPSADGQQAPVPWVLVNGRADLSQWDPAFWNGVKAQCQLAKTNGVIIHFDFFDGVSMRDQGGAAYGYNGSFWNPANQTAAFYPSGYYGDGSGGFYRLSDFNNNTGIGYYQRALIDKACAELAPYDNVFFEVGNELLGSDANWNTAVIAYIKTKTSKPVSTVGENGNGLQGYSDHIDDTVAQLKSSLASMVGHGYPAWVDPDGSQIEFLPPDGIRNCYWTALASGAAAYGGFTCDFWTWPVNPPPGFNTLKGVYCQNLQNFLTTTGMPFWNMIPQGSLVSNNSVNCCLANAGSTYMAYILSDGSATVDLTAVSGNAYYKLYDPASGTYSGQNTVAGGAVRSFTRPAGASDWVIYVYTTLPSHGQLNVKSAGSLTIDGNPNDWNLGNYSSYAYGGGNGAGDIALVGYSNGTLRYGSYAGILPTSAADHTAKVYAAHDATYEYFLVRCDDDDIRYSNPTSANWLNDCVEFYVDPSNAGGSSSINNSTSDCQLVIDANNQKNVYCTTGGYATQILNGVTSGVQRDSTGWWLEVRLAKNAFSPALPLSGSFGLDFNFRDNDNNNDANLTTVYTWNDASYSGFPSKIPDNWGHAFQIAPGETPYGGSAINLPGTIEAEYFDNGGEGVAYHDAESVNYGGAFRTGEGVDIAATSDAGGGYEVGWVNANEWLNYMVYVNATRAYDLNLRVSGGGGNLHISIDGQNVTGARTTPNTGSWTTYATYTIPSITLAAGSHVLTVYAETGGFNLNWLSVTVPPIYWDTPGPLQNVGAGQMPCVCVDSSGNIHVAYGIGNGIAYKKYNSSWTLQTSETITSPSGGSYWLNMALDSNGVPHIVFSEAVGSPNMPYACYAFYTNRIGGSWKSPITAVNVSGTANVFNHRIAVHGNYAYLGYQYGTGEALVGRIDRVTNLSGTPSVDRTITTATRSCVVADGNGNVWALGRNGGANTAVQEYDYNLNPIGGLTNISPGTGKPGAPAAAFVDKYNIVHMVAWGIEAGGSGVCADRCGLVYNNNVRWSPLLGMLGPGGGSEGPTGTEPTGFWNDDVSPAICRDALDNVYIAWRNWSASGEGEITKVDPNAGFTIQNCKSDALCGGAYCTGSQFAQTCTYRRWQNVELAAPPTGGGVYVAYENGGQCYIQPIGITAVVDTTLPGDVTNLTDQAEQGMNILRWTNPGDSDLTGVRIVWKTDGTYPNSVSDGTTCFDGPGTSFTHSGLTNGTTYRYKVFAHDMVPNYASGAQTSGTPTLDTTAPGNITSFTGTPNDAQVTLNWTNPGDSDLFGVKILFKTSGYPTGPNDASAGVCFNGPGTSFTHTGLTNDIPYYYKAYSFDEVPNYPSGVQLTATPHNPQYPYNGVIQVPGTIQAENYDNGGEGIAWHDTTSGNTGGVYRSDDVDIQACGDTGGGYNVGWTAAGEWLEYGINVAATGDYNIGVRLGSGQATNGYRIKIDGADITGVRTFASTGGYQTYTTIMAPTRYLTAGQHILQLYVDSGDPTLNYIQIDSRGPDGISTDLDTNNIDDGLNMVTGVGDGDTVGWTAAGHNFRENIDINDLYMYFNVNDGWCYQGSKADVYVTFDYYDIGTGTLGIDYDSSSSSYQHVAGPTMTNSLTFKSYTFHVTNAYFGNRENGGADFRITGVAAEWGIDTVSVYTLPGDTTPPGNVTSFTASAGDRQINLSWANPTDPDFTGVKILYKTGANNYPSGPNDGTATVVYDGSGTSYLNTSLTNGTVYNYRAYAHDAVPNYAAGVQATGTPQDTTPPANLTGFTVNRGDMQNSLSWTNPTDADFAGVKILVKTGSYPTGPNDNSTGVSVVYDSTGTSYLHTGLTNGVTYYYKAYAHDGVPNYNLTGAQGTGTPADTTPPADVTGFLAQSGDTRIVLSWSNPNDADFAGVKVLCKTGGYPSGATDATARTVYSGLQQGITDAGLTNGTTYYYKVYAYDEVPNYSSGVQASAVPADVTAPGNVTSFAVAPGNTQNILTWVNPADADLAGVKIMFRTNAYPSGPTDGTQCYSGTGTTTTHTGLTNGVTYYYKAFAFDEVPNYSSGAQGIGTPYGMLTINTKNAANINLVIDGNSSDWNLATNFTTKAHGGTGETGDYAILGYDGATLYYGGYWTGGVLPTSASDHTAKIYSMHDQQYVYFLVRCDDDDMQYSQPTSMNWANDCIEFYIDPAGAGGSSSISNSTSDIQLDIDCNNQKNVYMTTSGYATQILNGVTSAVVRDGTGWWMECKILKTALDPDLPNSGSFGLDFMCRDNDNNNDVTKSTSYTWKDPSTALGFPSKVPNNWGKASLAALSADTTPPAPVTSFSATPSGTQNNLAWTNPATSDWAGTQVRFKTTGYPTGPADGTQIYNGTGASYQHTGLSMGVTYYYGAYAYDEVPNYATAAQASGTIAGDSTAPSFGGSISPSLTGSLTPTVTITAQDTGVGLNVASADFAYSVDGGTSFTSYVGRYTLHSKGTGSGGGNMYWYPDFYHPSYTIVSGDHLQYDIYSNNSDGTGAVDLEGGLGNLRDSGITDQNGLSGHPGTNLYSRDYHQWYHRDFNLTTKAGQTITDFEMGHETDSGVSEFYVRNVIITNNGQVKVKAADADSWSSVNDTAGPGNNGYSSTVGPEMLTSDPASPSACSGSNGTTASQNVTATFSSTALMPLVGNGNNRIKYRISDMNANRATSSTFTITVDNTPPSNVTGFTGSPGNHHILLSWTNPGSDFTGTKILFKTSGYPTGPTDGTSIYDSNGTSYDHTGLTNGVTYYYKAFAHDGIPNYASGAQVSSAPTGTPQSITIQRGTYGTVTDAYIRQDGNPDTNFGNPLDPMGLRVYGDSGYGSKGPRHNLIKFDLSFIPAGSTINSATFGEYYWQGTGRPNITGLKLSRLQSGAGWVEGNGDATTVNPWPTWNQRQYGATNWGTAGATGSSDIDTSTTKAYDLTGGTDGFRTVDVTSFVDAWVNNSGTWPNNGMLMWGGTDSANTANGYWMESCSENSTVANRPYLTVNYTAP